MSDEHVTENEIRLASTLFYGILGGISGAASCCCWPGSVFVAWLATRRAVTRGVVEPGGGLSYGLGIGVVMALVMSTLGTAVALSGLDGPQFESMGIPMADTPLWLLAGVSALLLGAVGLGSGLLGGLLASSARQKPAEPRPARSVPTAIVPVPGSMESNSPVTTETDVTSVPHTDSAAAVQRRTSPSTFVTAETEPGHPAPVLPDGLESLSDVEQTLVVEQEPPSGEDELREWSDVESTVQEGEGGDDSPNEVD